MYEPTHQAFYLEQSQYYFSYFNFFSEVLFAADGEALFKANCASCHKPLEHYVGPALKGAREREPSKDWVYKWIPNTTSMVNTDPYAMKLKDHSLVTW